MRSSLNVLRFSCVLLFLMVPSIAQEAQTSIRWIDPLLSEGKDYATRLRSAGVQVNYTVFTGSLRSFSAWEQWLTKGKLQKSMLQIDLVPRLASKKSK